MDMKSQYSNILSIGKKSYFCKQIKIKMRHLLIVILSTFLWNPTHIFAQVEGVKRFITIEQISNSRCPICGNRIPKMKTNLTPYKEHIHLISFFASFPYSSCPYYQANTQLNNARVSYYSPPGTPHVYVWGVNVNENDSIITKKYIEDRLDEKSQIEFVIEPNGEESVSITILNHGELAGNGPYRLLVWVVEKTVIGGPLPSYQNHDNVARYALTEYNGDEIQLPEIGEELNIQFDLPELMPIGNGDFAIIAYIQSVDKTILNSNMADIEKESSRTETVKINSINITPNPANNIIYVEQLKTNDNSVLIYDLNGRIVLSKTNISGSIEIGNLTPGWYTVKVKSNDEHFQGKFFKAN
jgi:hypothetical protein